MEVRRYHNIPFILFSIILMLTGIWSGLVRLGWQWPQPQGNFVLLHGVLMVEGFLGTLIGLERAVGIKKLWGYSAPFFTAVGTVLYFLFPEVPFGGAFLITLGSLVLTLIFVKLISIHKEAALWVMAFGTLVWFIGNIFWMAGTAIPFIVPWWAGFLIITIAGERLELTKFLNISENKKRVFISYFGFLLLGIIIYTFRPEIGARIFGMVNILIAAWLFQNDIARRTIRLDGLTRFIAASLISGYFWLGFSGLLSLVYGGVLGGMTYDAVWHTIFLGFVFSMIFGHAPIIFPAVLQVKILYKRLFYVPLILLHLSLVLRVAGDILVNPFMREWGGMLNGITILLFFITVISSLRRNDVA